MAFRDFLRGTFKIALAMFIAVVALTGVGWGILAYKERNEKLEAQQYEVVKTWRSDLKDYLQLDLVARTKLVDGRLRVDLEVQGYPAYLSHPRLAQKNQEAQFLITFADQDGFKIYEKAVKIAEFSGRIDTKGARIGLNHQFEEYVGVTSYKSFSAMRVRWTLDTVIPPEPKIAAAPAPTLKPKVATLNEPDHCAPGLSKEDRLLRLAKHGVVRQTAEGTYTVGSRQVTFYSQRAGGGMLACR